MKTGISIDPLGVVEHHEFQDVDGNENTQWIHDKIGGYLQLVPGIPVSMFCNEDGRRLNLPINYTASILAGQAILGTVVILGPANGRGDCTGLLPDQIRSFEGHAEEWRGTLTALETLHN